MTTGFSFCFIEPRHPAGDGSSPSPGWICKPVSRHKQQQLIGLDLIWHFDDFYSANIIEDMKQRKNLWQTISGFCQTQHRVYGFGKLADT